MIKAYFLLREDIKMSMSKFAIQIGHGTDFIWKYKNANHDKWVKESLRRKIVLKVGTMEKLENLKKILLEAEIPYEDIIDEGFTEFGKVTQTGIVILPIEEKLLPKSISRLQLFR
jgi:peptidyl-tRNA hydrolase